MDSIDSFLVFFIPEIESKTVTIIRVMYKKRNIEDQFNKMD